MVAEVCELRDSAQVEDLQDQAQIMLRDHVTQQYPTSRYRFGKLLLLLPVLRTISPRLVESVFFRAASIGGAVTVERLICDMFKNC